MLQKYIGEEVNKKKKDPENETGDADDFDNVYEDTGNNYVWLVAWGWRSSAFEDNHLSLYNDLVAGIVGMWKEQGGWAAAVDINAGSFRQGFLWQLLDFTLFVRLL